jgi:hypothetical protein
VSEVKNVSSLSYSSQLRDYVSYAQQTRRQVDLYVRGGSSRTRLSGPLHERDPRPERPDQPEVHSVSAKRSKRSKRGPIYATDLMAELEADPEYVAHQKRRDAELAHGGGVASSAGAGGRRAARGRRRGRLGVGSGEHVDAVSGGAADPASASGAAVSRPGP